MRFNIFFFLVLNIFGCGMSSSVYSSEILSEDNFITGDVVKCPLSDLKLLGIKIETEEYTESASAISLLLSDDLIEAVELNEMLISGSVFDLSGGLIISMPPVTPGSVDFIVKKGLIFRISFVSKMGVGAYRAGTTYLFDLVGY